MMRSSVPGTSPIPSMYNTSQLVYDEGNQLFRDVNDDTVASMVSVVVILVALMTAGLIGNVSVCYYYGFKIERTASSHFILVLSSFDLVMCTVGIPMEIVDLLCFYTFQNVIACKTLKLLDAFVAIGSLLTLLVIGIDRFRRICRPFKTQIERNHSKLLSVCVAITSLALSWPTWILYGIEDVPITTEKGMVLGKDCTFTKNESQRGYLIAMNSVYVVLFSIVVAVLVIMYLLITKAIFEQKKTRQKYLSTSLSSFGSKATVSGNDKTLDRSSNGKTLLRSSEHINTHHDFVIDKKTAKFTLLMLTITVTALLGFVPYLALSVWRILQGKHPSEVLDRAELVGFQIGIRSVMLNAAINPLIYGLFNPRVRAFWHSTLCCCCKRRTENNAVYQTEMVESHRTDV